MSGVQVAKQHCQILNCLRMLKTTYRDLPVLWTAAENTPASKPTSFWAYSRLPRVPNPFRVGRSIRFPRLPLFCLRYPTFGTARSSSCCGVALTVVCFRRSGCRFGSSSSRPKRSCQRGSTSPVVWQPASAPVTRIQHASFSCWLE